MLKSDVLSQLKQLKSDIKASRNLMSGIVKGTGQKFGFVTLEDTGKDIFLPPDEMQKVLPGDRVEVEIKKDAKNKNVAILERLLEPGVKTFCGKYVTKGSTHFVEPDLPGMSRWIFVPPPKRKKAQAKDFVKCRLTQHPFKNGKSQASVLDVIGGEQDAGIEWRYAMSKHDVADVWSESVTEELKKYDEALIESKKPERVDLTNVPFITIDAASTTDMDDALWAESQDEGWLLRVAIADPAALIEEGSVIEKEAFKRATSIYFPGQPVSMLPSKLSSDLCSLVADKDRLVKVIDIQVMPSGEIKGVEIVEAIINSRQKLSYGAVAAFLDGLGPEDIKSEEIKTNLTVLGEVAKALRHWRNEHALTNQDRDEFYLELGTDQKIVDIHKKVSNNAHALVEECMVAANRSVAEYLANNQVASLYVRHDGVRADRLEALTQLLCDRLELDSLQLDSLESFVELVKRLSVDEQHQDLYLLITRQLEKSTVSSEPAPHFGMGLPYYCNATSPIRKMSDYLVHKQLSALLKGDKPIAITPDQLTALEAAWQTARNSVYDVEQWLKCQFMQSRQDYFDASVQRIFASGFQVRLDENGIEGFVSTKEMEGKFSFHQNVLKLNGKQASFELGQKLQVRLKQIDWTRKQLQFEVKLQDGDQ